MRRRFFLSIAVIAATAALLLASVASATPPTTEKTAADYSQAFTGTDSPCGSDITFSTAGTVTVNTYFDNTGTPIRESAHGPLAHTVSSARSVEHTAGTLVIVAAVRFLLVCTPGAFEDYFPAIIALAASYGAHLAPPKDS